MYFISRALKVFLITAYKPIEGFLEILEEVMKMDKIMDVSNDNWQKNNEEIPLWFYQMIISMGISVCLGFLLILIGSLWVVSKYIEAFWDL